MSERHQLLAIWEKGRDHEAAILEMIAADSAFEIIGQIDVHWPAEQFSAALGQLYGERLPSRSEKQRHCGTGPFLVVILRDLDPRPGMRRTSRGLERVDTHIFDIKQEARRITGGGHRVHATDSAAEFHRDLVVLAQMTEDQLRTRGDWDRSTLRTAPEGAAGWGSVTTMLGALGRRMPYCVLRNFETWDQGGPIDDHPDIDLLVRSPLEAASALAAVPTSRRRGRVQFEVDLAGRCVNIDLRSPGDGYFPDELAERTINSVIWNPAGFMTPAPREHYETLAYHALVHREMLAADYEGRIGELAAAAGLAAPVLKTRADQQRLVRSLTTTVRLPHDPSVGFNDRLLGRVRGLTRRRAEQWIRSLGGRGLRRVGLIA